MPPNQNTLKMIEFAKAGITCAYKKRDWLEALNDLANTYRKPEETFEQAFTRILKTPDGAELYQQYRTAPGSSIPTPATQPPSLHDESPAWREIVRLASEIRKRDPSLSEAKAISAVLTTEDGRALRKRYREEVTQSVSRTDRLR